MKRIIEDEKSLRVPRELTNSFPLLHNSAVKVMVEEFFAIFPDDCIEAIYSNYDDIVKGFTVRYDCKQILDCANSKGLIKFEPYVCSKNGITALVWEYGKYLIYKYQDLDFALSTDSKLMSYVWNDMISVNDFIHVLNESASSTTDCEAAKSCIREGKAIGTLFYMSFIAKFASVNGFMDFFVSNVNLVDSFIAKVASNIDVNSVTFRDVCSYDGTEKAYVDNSSYTICITHDNTRCARVYLTKEHKVCIEVMDNGIPVIYEFYIPKIEDGLSSTEAEVITGNKALVHAYYNNPAIISTVVTSALARLGYSMSDYRIHLESDCKELPGLSKDDVTIKGGYKYLLEAISNYVNKLSER